MVIMALVGRRLNGARRWVPRLFLPERRGALELLWLRLQMEEGVGYGEPGERVLFVAGNASG